jgi:hypothetical protein
MFYKNYNACHRRLKITIRFRQDIARSAALASRPRVGCPGYARVGGQMGGDWLRSDDALGDAHAEKNPGEFNKKYSTIDWSGSTR